MSKRYWERIEKERNERISRQYPQIPKIDRNIQCMYNIAVKCPLRTSYAKYFDYCKKECTRYKEEMGIETKEKRNRLIPKSVQREVWRRDMGRCVECGSRELLEFDHIIPFSKGGSNTARNIQLLCEKCNRSKGNNI